MDRRTFIKASAAGVGLTITAGRTFGAPAFLPGAVTSPPNERIQVAMIGVRGRGNNVLRTFAGMPDVQIRYVCDIDQGVLRSRTDQTRQSGRHKPEAIGDFRRALDDKSIHAIALGTPDHWHAIPTILGCIAGKDVYVEKPDGHNVLESLTMKAAQLKHKRVVQIGTQARSGSHMREAIEYIQKGSLGRVRFATAWESAKQGSLGHPKDSDPPAGVDYDTWLGPAPKRPFNRLRFHGNWRWFFDYGAGDLGNDGVHRIDYARWALETALAAQGEKLDAIPKAVSAHGGKLYFDDAQEWPDTQYVTYDYGNCILTYEMRIWSPYPHHGESEGAAVYGDQGYVVLGNRRWRAYTRGGKLVKESAGKSNLDQTKLHVRDFLDCMQSREKTAADLATVGHVSSMLCHLGNLAWRVGRTVKFDAKTGSFPGDKEAQRLSTREEYRKPWTLPKIADV